MEVELFISTTSTNSGVIIVKLIQKNDERSLMAEDIVIRSIAIVGKKIKEVLEDSQVYSNSIRLFLNFFDNKKSILSLPLKRGKSYFHIIILFLLEWVLCCDVKNTTVTMKVGEDDSSTFLHLPDSAFRDSYRMKNKTIFNNLQNTSLHTYDDFYPSIYKCIWANKDFSLFDNIDDNECQQIEDNLLRYAINGMNCPDDELGICAYINSDQDEYDFIELSAFHPQVVLQRMFCTYTIEKYILSKETMESFHENLTIGIFPIFEQYSQMITKQFYNNRGLYVLDHRRGVLTMPRYEKSHPYGSLRPINLTHIIEKIILDIREVKASEELCEKISILLIGSIEYEQVKRLLKILEYEIPSEKIILDVWSPYPDSNSIKEKNESNRINYSCFPASHYKDLESLVNSIVDYHIVFLADPIFLYDYIDMPVVTKGCGVTLDFGAQSAIESKTESFVRYLNSNYMKYDGIYSLMLNDLLQRIEKHSWKMKMNHLCVLLSYSNQPELLSYSKETQEVRKEIVLPGHYTTLLRYRFDHISTRNNYYLQQKKSIYFMFRLHQWLKITDSYLDLRQYELTGNIELSTILFHTICKLIIENGKPKLILYFEDKKCPLPQKIKQSIISNVNNRINFLFNHSDNLCDANEVKLYGWSIIANLLVSRSISKEHLLWARAAVYYDGIMPEAFWADEMQDEQDYSSMDFNIEDYNSRLRLYHLRYADYLILCAIDKSMRNEDSIANAYMLIDVLGRPDGFAIVKSLGDTSHKLLLNEKKYPAGVESYLNRIDSQAKYLIS